jgi:hypothetical protein
MGRNLVQTLVGTGAMMSALDIDEVQVKDERTKKTVDAVQGSEWHV